MRTDKTSVAPRSTRPRRAFTLPWILSLGLCLLLLAAQARAAPETDSSGAEEDARAQAHDGQPNSDPAARAAFEAGRAAYDHGRFAEALAQFELAYELSRLPRLLFNIARAAESDGRDERAISAYSAYLHALPDADNRDFVEARVRRLRGADEDATHAVTTSVPSPRAAAELDVANEQATPRHGTTRDNESSPRPLYKRGWFWALIGVGAVGAAIAGTVVANRNHSGTDSYDLSVRALRVPE